MDLDMQRRSVGKLAAELDGDWLGTGPMAELRRLNPSGSLASPTLQRLLIQHVPTDHAPALRLWALFIHALALVSPQQGTRLSFGEALFAAGYTEGRLSRLLAARAPEMPDLVPRAMRLLRARGIAVSPASLWDLLHAVGTDASWVDDARTRLARAYYQAENAAKPADQKGSAA